MSTPNETTHMPTASSHVTPFPVPGAAVRASEQPAVVQDGLPKEATTDVPEAPAAEQMSPGQVQMLRIIQQLAELDRMVRTAHLNAIQNLGRDPVFIDALATRLLESQALNELVARSVQASLVEGVRLATQAGDVGDQRTTFEDLQAAGLDKVFPEATADEAQVGTFSDQSVSPEALVDDGKPKVVDFKVDLDFSTDSEFPFAATRFDHDHPILPGEVQIYIHASPELLAHGHVHEGEELSPASWQLWSKAPVRLQQRIMEAMEQAPTGEMVRLAVHQIWDRPVEGGVQIEVPTGEQPE